MQKNTSKSRLYFRRTLLVVAALSAVFFASMITLRMNKGAHWYVVRNYQNEIFTIDVIKHQLTASLNNEAQKHEIAASLLQKGVFSNIYTDAGIDMMKKNADEGYPPSQFTYATVLDKQSLKLDEITKAIVQDEAIQMKARYYYHLAAAENYAPAIEKLEDIPE